jgi:(p)ppGpp synthase/HD superfamily hydrolase
LVDSVAHTDEMVAAAWLHEVVRCPGVSFHMIHDLFGYRVAEHVEELNIIPYELVRNETWGQYSACLRMISSVSNGTKTIKLADIISDMQSLHARWQDKETANTTLLRYLAMLESLKGGDPILWDMANTSLHKAIQDMSEHFIMFDKHPC